MKNRIYYALAFIVAIISIAAVSVPAFAADNPEQPRLFNGYQLQSTGNISYVTESGSQVEFHSSDLYHLAEEINFVIEKIK